MRLPVYLLSLATLIAPHIQAEDWPQWFGPQRNGHVAAGSAVPKALPAALKPLWHLPIGAGLASPIVSNGKVIYLDNPAPGTTEVVHAVETATGKELWKVDLDSSFKDGQSAPGPRCTPATDGELLFVQSCKGELKCLNLTDGKLVWSTNYVKDHGAVFIGEKGTAEGAARHGYTGSPVIDGDRLLTQPGGKDTGVVCFEKKTGKVIWKSQSDIAGYSPPVIATIAGTKQIVAFTVEGVLGLDSTDGKLLWKVPMKTNFGRHVTTPLVVDDIVLVASNTAGLVASKITKTGTTFKAEPAWPAKKEFAINFSSPVAVGDTLYALGPTKNIISVDIKTGTQGWTKEGFNSFASIMVMGQNLLILSDKGELVLIAADPKAYKEIGRVQACATNWCNPAYADGKLYLRDSKELWCMPLLP